MEEVEILLVVIFILSLIYILGEIIYTYKVYKRGEYSGLEFVDLESLANSKSYKSCTCKIEPVQVYLLDKELNISLLGLSLNSEIMIMNGNGEVVYAITTNKCYGRIALKISNWEKGIYVFSYSDSAISDSHKKYISGVFEV